MGFGDGLSGRGPHDYDEAGHFRWPKAIVMVRAWRSMPQPVLLDVLAEQLPYHAAPQAVLLDGGDADAVMSLNAEEVKIPASEALVKARLLDKALNPGRPTTGPEPSTSEGSVGGREQNRVHLRVSVRADGHLENRARHRRERKAQAGQLSYPAGGGAGTVGCEIRQAWDSETDAYAMEQRVFRSLTASRTEGERVRCTEAELRAAWLAGIGP